MLYRGRILARHAFHRGGVIAVTFMMVGISASALVFFCLNLGRYCILRRSQPLFRNRIITSL